MEKAEILVFHVTPIAERTIVDVRGDEILRVKIRLVMHAHSPRVYLKCLFSSIIGRALHLFALSVNPHFQEKSGN